MHEQFWPANFWIIEEAEQEAPPAGVSPKPIVPGFANVRYKNPRGLMSFGGDQLAEHIFRLR
jgi:hypothetical protein